MSFRELVYLAECFGFRLMRQRESHRIYERSGEDRPIVLTEQRGAAPEYQARQVLKALFPDESDQ